MAVGEHIAATYLYLIIYLSINSNIQTEPLLERFRLLLIDKIRMEKAEIMIC